MDPGGWPDEVASSMWVALLPWLNLCQILAYYPIDTGSIFCCLQGKCPVGVSWNSNHKLAVFPVCNLSPNITKMLHGTRNTDIITTISPPPPSGDTRVQAGYFWHCQVQLFNSSRYPSEWTSRISALLCPFFAIQWLNLLLWDYPFPEKIFPDSHWFQILRSDFGKVESF